MRPKYRFDLKQFLAKLYPILKFCIILLPKNNVYLLDSQMQISQRKTADSLAKVIFVTFT